MEWHDFKKTFTQAQEDALWQYFLDHSRIQRNGYFCITFFVRNVDDFWRRLNARASGEFHRYEVEDRETAALQRREIYEKLLSELRYTRHISSRNSTISSEIDRAGSLWDRLLLRLYRYTRKALFESGRPYGTPQ